MGIILEEAADEIARHCHAGEICFAKLRVAMEHLGRPVLPVVQQTTSPCSDGLG